MQAAAAAFTAPVAQCCSCCPSLAGCTCDASRQAVHYADMLQSVSSFACCMTRPRIDTSTPVLCVKLRMKVSRSIRRRSQHFSLF